VEIREFGSGAADEGVEFAPVVLSASKGEPGAGATFVYDAALGTAVVLEPGRVSGAMLWKFRLRADPRETPGMHLFISGKRP